MNIEDDMQKTSDPADAHIASSFVEKHLEVGDGR